MKTNTISLSGLHSRGFESKRQNSKYYTWYTKSWIVQWRKVNRKWGKESGGEVVTLSTVQGRPHFRNNEELRGMVNITLRKTGKKKKVATAGFNLGFSDSHTCFVLWNIHRSIPAEAMCRLDRVCDRGRKLTGFQVWDFHWKKGKHKLDQEECSRILEDPRSPVEVSGLIQLERSLVFCLFY